MVEDEPGGGYKLRMRTGSLVLILLTTGCGVLGPVAHFAPIQDLQTTHARSNAESGHGVEVEPPAGISWTLSLDGYELSPIDDAPARSFEFYISLRDILSTDRPRCTPRIDDAELVDDSGRRYRCYRARIPDETAERTRKKKDEDEPARAEYTLIFDLPSTYRFLHVSHVTVHWVLDLDDGTSIPISSRFRS